MLSGGIPAGGGDSRRQPSTRTLAQNASQPLQITLETPCGFKALASPDRAGHPDNAAARCLLNDKFSL